jgi:hypothetical protein
MGPARLECFDRCLFEAVYSQQAPLVFESHNGITLYKGEEALQFKLVECGQPIAMRLPPGYADRVPVQPGRTYQVGAKLLPASPNTNGVMIHEDDQLIFQGVYDWYAGRTITFIESSPIQVYQHSTLTNHYSTESPCSNKVFHTRIASSMDDEEILLH